MNAHNRLRAEVYSGNGVGKNNVTLPAASTTPADVTWDADLAAGAQTWADQCKGGHDSGADRRSNSNKSGSVGQNAYASWGGYSATFNFAAPVESWYSEIKDVTEAMLRSYPSNPPAVIGHFTQVVWGDSTKVGCGISQYAVDGDNGTVLYYTVILQ